jgi:hypothetical protein
MKQFNFLSGSMTSFIALVTALALAGCASTGSQSSDGGGASGPSGANKFKATDGRNIEVGKPSQADGGTRYDNPHMEKGKCWVASGFNFNGYDTIYIAPTTCTAKFNEKSAEEVKVNALAKERLVAELERKLNELKIFATVVTNESGIKPGAKALKLENTITEFTKGGGAARYFVGLYGGGQPILRVAGKMSEGDKALFNYEARRSGTSAGARMTGVFMKDEDIQVQDIQSLVLDLTDFMAAVAGKYQPR